MNYSHEGRKTILNLLLYSQWLYAFKICLSFDCLCDMLLIPAETARSQVRGSSMLIQ